ncbi:unnamed protein product [Arabidopsis halleri]
MVVRWRTFHPREGDTKPTLVSPVNESTDGRRVKRRASAGKNLQPWRPRRDQQWS